MKPDPGKLLEDALKLSPEGRVALASSLLESLGETVDEGAEAAWAEEIGTRIRNLDSGSAPTPTTTASSGRYETSRHG